MGGRPVSHPGRTEGRVVNGDGGGRAVPPAVDPEVRAAGVGAGEPLTPENLAARQARDAAARPRPGAAELRDGGRFEVAELAVPGLGGGPE
ncbi:hypothetical protein VR45_18170, partial [Streptomyces sp. NRRL S-495]